jgi:hypothetical protein
VKNIVGGVLGLILGGALIIFGVVTSNRAVTCGEQAMKPGDTCVSVTGGTGTDYDAQHAKDERRGLLAMGAGGVLVVLGGLAIGVQIRRNRRAAAPPAAA